MRSFRDSLCTALYKALAFQNVDDTILRARALSAAQLITDPTMVSSSGLRNCTLFLTSSVNSYAELACSSPSTAVSLVSALSIALRYTNSRQVDQSTWDKASMTQEIQSSLSTLSAGCQSHLSPGEGQFEIITENVRMATVVVDASFATNLTMTSPITALQSNQNDSQGSISFGNSLADLSDEAGISIVQFTNNPLSIVSNSTPLSLEITPFGGRRRLQMHEKEWSRMTTEVVSNDPVRIVLKNVNEIAYGRLSHSIIVVNCSEWSNSEYYFQERCPDSTMVNITCKVMEKGQYVIRCPGLQSVPRCARWNDAQNAFVQDPLCSVMSYSAGEVTCDCRLPLSSSSSRRLQTGGGYQAQFSSIIQLVREDLSISYTPGVQIDFAENSVVITSTVLAFESLLVVALLTYFVYKRKDDIRKSKMLLKGKENAAIEATAMPIANTASSHIRTVRSFFKSLYPGPRSKITWRRYLWNSLVQQRFVFSWLDSHRPVLSALGFVEVLAKSWICFLLATVLVYVFYTDDNSCQHIIVHNECLNKKTFLGTQNKCRWVPVNESCTIEEHLDNSPLIVILIQLVTFVSSVLGYFVHVTVDMLISEVERRFLTPGFAAVPVAILDEQITLEDKKKLTISRESSSNGNAKVAIESEQVADSVPVDYNNFQADESKKNNDPSEEFEFDEFIDLQTRHRLLLRAARVTKIMRISELVTTDQEAKYVQRIIDRKIELSKPIDASLSFSVFMDQMPRVLGHYDKDLQKWNEKKVQERIEHVVESARNISHRLMQTKSMKDRERLLMLAFMLEVIPSFYHPLILHMLREAPNTRDLMVAYDYSNKSPTQWQSIWNQVRPWLGGLMLLALFGGGGYAAYLMGIELGDKAVPLWLLLFFVPTVQHLVLIDFLQIICLHVGLKYRVLTEVYRVLWVMLRDRARLTMMRTSGMLRRTLMSVQHLNAACRVARANPSWPVSRYLIAMNDNDIAPDLTFAQHKTFRKRAPGAPDVSVSITPGDVYHIGSLAGFALGTWLSINSITLLLTVLLSMFVSGIVIGLFVLSVISDENKWIAIIVVVVLVGLLLLRESVIIFYPPYYLKYYGEDKELFESRGRRAKPAGLNKKSRWTLWNNRRKIAVIPSSRYAFNPFNEEKSAYDEDGYGLSGHSKEGVYQQRLYLSVKRKPGSSIFPFSPAHYKGNMVLAQQFDYYRQNVRRKRRLQHASVAVGDFAHSDEDENSQVEDEDYQQWISVSGLSTRPQKRRLWMCHALVSPSATLLQRQVSFSMTGNAQLAMSPGLTPLSHNTIALNNDSLLLPAPTYQHGFSSAGETSAEEGEDPLQSSNRSRNQMPASAQSTLPVILSRPGSAVTADLAGPPLSSILLQQEVDTAGAVNSNAIFHAAQTQNRFTAVNAADGMDIGVVTSTVQPVSERPASASQALPSSARPSSNGRPKTSLPRPHNAHTHHHQLPRPHQHHAQAVAESSLISSSGSDNDSEHESYYHDNDNHASSRRRMRPGSSKNLRRRNNGGNSGRRNMRPVSTRAGVVRPISAANAAGTSEDTRPSSAKDAAEVVKTADAVNKEEEIEMNTADLTTTMTNRPLPASSGLNMTHRQRERLNRLYHAKQGDPDSSPKKRSKSSSGSMMYRTSSSGKLMSAKRKTQSAQFTSATMSAAARAASATNTGSEDGPGAHSAQARSQEYFIQPPRDYGFRVVNQHHHHYYYYLSPPSPSAAAAAAATERAMYGFPSSPPASAATMSDLVPSAMMVAHFHDEYAPPVDATLLPSTPPVGSPQQSPSRLMSPTATTTVPFNTNPSSSKHNNSNNVTVHHVHHYSSSAHTPSGQMPLPWTPMTSPSRNRHSDQFRVSRMLSGFAAEDEEGEDLQLEDDDEDDLVIDIGDGDQMNPQLVRQRSKGVHPAKKARRAHHQSLRQRRRLTRQAYQRSQQLAQQDQQQGPTPSEGQVSQPPAQHSVATAPVSMIPATRPVTAPATHYHDGGNGGNGHVSLAALQSPLTPSRPLPYQPVLPAHAATISGAPGLLSQQHRHHSVNALLSATRPVENMYFGMRDILLGNVNNSEQESTVGRPRGGPIGGFMMSRPGTAHQTNANDSGNSPEQPQTSPTTSPVAELRYQGRLGSSPSSPIGSRGRGGLNQQHWRRTTSVNEEDIEPDNEAADF
jgi:hypothetical protein